MKKNDRYTALFWAAVGLFVALEGHQLKIGTPSAPGSGFIIFWSGITLAGLGMILVFRTLSMGEVEEKERTLWKGYHWSSGVKIVIAILAYAFALRWVGFLLTNFFFLLFLLKSLQRQKWKIALTFAAIVTAFCYLVFSVLLNLRFPEGILSYLRQWIESL